MPQVQEGAEAGKVGQADVHSVRRCKKSPRRDQPRKRRQTGFF